MSSSSGARRRGGDRRRLAQVIGREVSRFQETSYAFDAAAEILALNRGDLPAMTMLLFGILGWETMVQSVLPERPLESRRSSSKLTYDDYVRLPDDGLRHEIIDGEHYVTPSPVTRHQRISGRLFHLLQSCLDEHPLGEVFAAPFDVVLSQFDVVVPDLIYLSRERAERLLTSKNLPGPPDLVVEILSPGTRSRDERLKRDLYARAGVREYWLIDPDRDVVRVYGESGGGFGVPRELSKDGGGVLTTALLPDLEIPLERLLA